MIWVVRLAVGILCVGILMLAVPIFKEWRAPRNKTACLEVQNRILLVKACYRDRKDITHASKLFFAAARDTLVESCWGNTSTIPAFCDAGQGPGSCENYTHGEGGLGITCCIHGPLQHERWQRRRVSFDEATRVGLLCRGRSYLARCCDF